MKIVLKMLQDERNEIQKELASDLTMANENRGNEDWQKLRLKSIRDNKKYIRELDKAMLILKTS